MAQMLIAIAVIAGGIFYFVATYKARLARVPVLVKNKPRR
jgi:hypothetical protein